jgi:class 3 adenylate cyclase/tetratricopeptide (TPR) repeat protein
MAFADISGFSRLSEQLAAGGPAGTEELTDLINASFESLIAAVAAHGGDVLKIVGDGLLVWFDGAHHAERAAAGCRDMHRALGRPLVASTGRSVRLRMSAGAGSGTFTFLMTSGRHRELVVCGRAASDVMRCEKIAEPGETVVDLGLAALLPPRSLGARRELGRLLRRSSVAAPPPPARPGLARRTPDLTAYIPTVQRELRRIAAPGEHRQCAIAFVSIDGTDDVLERDGPAAVHRLVSTVSDVVDEATARWGTQFLSSDNAANAVGMMLTGGVPTSSGEDEERLLRTVRDIVDACSDVPLRAGVHHGRIYSGFVGSSMRHGFTAVGDAVNVSARLMQNAALGQIVASRSVLDWSDTRFDEQPLAPFRVKNRGALVEASVVGAAAERKPRGAAHDLPFTGHERELAALEDAATRAADGRGSVVVVVGDPGVGKSRLLVELRLRRPGMTAVVLAADEYSSAIPYSLVRTLLADLGGLELEAAPDTLGAALRAFVRTVAPDQLPWLPLLAAAFGATVAPTREVDELADEFRSSRLRQTAAVIIDRALADTTLIGVDDAQWIDDASADLIADIIGAVASRPRLICVLVSAAEPPPWTAGAAVVAVAPLRPEETTALAVAASTGRVARRDLAQLVDRSGGNPLFLANLVDTAADSGEIDTLPSTIERLVTRRIDDLEPRDRVLLRDTAVAGTEIDLAVLGRALGSTAISRPDAWRRLSAFVGPAEPGRLRFRHGMYQRVAYEGLSFRRRREVHLAIGSVLEHDGAPPAVLSLHFTRAEDHARAYRWSVEGARAAQRAYANAEATELYRRALTSATRVPDIHADTRAGLAEALGDVLELSADYDAAAAAYGDARRAAGSRSPRTAARLVRKLGVLREHAGAYSDALRRYARAIGMLHAAGGADSTGELAELELAYAGVRHRQGRHVEARQAVGRAIELATAARDDVALGHAYYLLTIIDVALGDTHPASGKTALALLERQGDLVQQANLYNNLGVAAYFAGDWDAALADYERSRDLGRRTGDAVLEATLANNIGEILSDRGALDDAIELFRSALVTFRAASYPLGIALATGNLGRAHLRRGEVATARGLLEEAHEAFETSGAVTFVADMLVRLGECATAAGDAAAALVLLDAAADRLRTAPDPFVTVGMRRARAEALLAADRLSEAVIDAEESVELADALGAAFETARSLSVRADARRALAAAADEDATAADELFAFLGVGVSARATPARLASRAAVRADNASHVETTPG